MDAVGAFPDSRPLIDSFLLIGIGDAVGTSLKDLPHPAGFQARIAQVDGRHRRRRRATGLIRPNSSFDWSAAHDERRLQIEAHSDWGGRP